MSLGRIENPAISVKISDELNRFIKEISDEEATPGIEILRCLKSSKTVLNEDRKPTQHQYLMTEENYKDLNNLTEGTMKPDSSRKSFSKGEGGLLNLEDLHWVYKKIQEHNKTNKEKIYLHELLENSEVILPKNTEVPRDPELEKRCKTLKAQQENVKYKTMTKNVDNVRKRHPEDSIAFQLNQLNRHLIAIAQFVVSVLAGFAFGFIGLEYVLGDLDFGFRLLLGIICALIIALAELYFLAKKLNEETNFEAKVQEMSKHSKLN